MPQKKFYILPARFTYVAAATFVASVVLNLIGILVALKGDLNSNVSPQRMIQPRAAALEVVDSDHYGLHDDNDWASITPLGHGFVKFGDDFYALSMYHQMHCLNGFRRMFNRNRTIPYTEHDTLHMVHCLSYLRQMILCSADVTLEPAFSVIDKGGRESEGAYGTGVIHQCRDWVEVRQFAENNYGRWKEEAAGFVATEMSAVYE